MVEYALRLPLLLPWCRYLSYISLFTDKFFVHLSTDRTMNHDIWGNKLNPWQTNFECCWLNYSGLIAYTWNYEFWWAVTAGVEPMLTTIRPQTKQIQVVKRDKFETIPILKLIIHNVIPWFSDKQAWQLMIDCLSRNFRVTKKNKKKTLWIMDFTVYCASSWLIHL